MTQPTAENSKHVIINEGKGGAVSLFPTVCYVKPHGNIEKLNAELKRFILEQEQATKGLAKSSIKGGYHSDRKFLEQDNWAIKDLRQIIANDAMEYLKSFWGNESNMPYKEIGEFKLHMSGWSVILRAGDISVPHLHPRSNISGVYYVTNSKPSNDNFQGGGQLVFTDPRIRAGVYPVRNQASTAMLSPVEGNIVMFPSYMEHYVLPFKGEGERISIAFNIAFSPNMVGGDY